jgi:hypothetical protein
MSAVPRPVRPTVLCAPRPQSARLAARAIYSRQENVLPAALAAAAVVPLPAALLAAKATCFLHRLAVRVQRAARPALLQLSARLVSAGIRFRQDIAVRLAATPARGPPAMDAVAAISWIALQGLVLRVPAAARAALEGSARHARLGLLCLAPRVFHVRSIALTARHLHGAISALLDGPWLRANAAN